MYRTLITTGAGRIRLELKPAESDSIWNSAGGYGESLSERGGREEGERRKWRERREERGERREERGERREERREREREKDVFQAMLATRKHARVVGTSGLPQLPRVGVRNGDPSPARPPFCPFVLLSYLPVWLVYLSPLSMTDSQTARP